MDAVETDGASEGIGFLFGLSICAIFDTWETGFTAEFRQKFSLLLYFALFIRKIRGMEINCLSFQGNEKVRQIKNSSWDKRPGFKVFLKKTFKKYKIVAIHSGFHLLPIEMYFAIYALAR